MMMNTINRASILSLYRRCMRSIQKMPDFNQRASYLIYLRDSFRRRAHIPLKSREVILAYRDGLEQIDSMEYYHSQMKVKQNEVQQESISLPNKSSTSGETSKSHISEWLLEVLPHLNEGDVTTYTRHLVDDGFDSVSFMKEELLSEDLSFMKKAHRRVIERKMKEWIDSR